MENILNILKKIPEIKIKLNLILHKIINSIGNWKKDKRKRQDLEKIRRDKSIANFEKNIGNNEKFVIDYFEKEARITEDTLED